MPIYKRKDSKGPYYQYGSKGAKYYFNSTSERSETIAYNKAVRQTQAIHANR